MTDWTKPCACGGTVTANPDDPTPGVQAHNATEQHESWSLDVDDREPYRPLPKLTVGPLTVDRLRELGLAPKPTPRGLRG